MTTDSFEGYEGYIPNNNDYTFFDREGIKFFKPNGSAVTSTNTGIFNIIEEIHGSCCPGKEIIIYFNRLINSKFNCQLFLYFVAKMLDIDIESITIKGGWAEDDTGPIQLANKKLEAWGTIEPSLDINEDINKKPILDYIFDDGLANCSKQFLVDLFEKPKDGNNGNNGKINGALIFIFFILFDYLFEITLMNGSQKFVMRETIIKFEEMKPELVKEPKKLYQYLKKLYTIYTTIGEDGLLDKITEIYKRYLKDYDPNKNKVKDKGLGGFGLLSGWSLGGATIDDTPYKQALDKAKSQISSIFIGQRQFGSKKRSRPKKI
jgi:hypothetical protein